MVLKTVFSKKDLTPDPSSTNSTKWLNTLKQCVGFYRQIV